MFALISDGTIYLKAGDNNVAAFEREGLPPFTYQARKDRRAVMSYRRMPDRLYDDPDALAVWAREALAAAQKPRPERGGRSTTRAKPQKAKRAARA